MLTGGSDNGGNNSTENENEKKDDEISAVQVTTLHNAAAEGHNSCLQDVHCLEHLLTRQAIEGEYIKLFKSGLCFSESILYYVLFYLLLEPELPTVGHSRKKSNLERCLNYGIWRYIFFCTIIYYNCSSKTQRRKSCL